MNSIAQRTEPDWPRHIAKFGLWAVKTMLAAMLVPYLLVTVFLVVSTIAGMTIEDVRKNAIGFATMSSSDWEGMRGVWYSLCHVIYAFVFLAMLPSCPPLRRILDGVYPKLDVWGAALVARLDKVETRSKKFMFILIGVMVIGIMGALLTSNKSIAPPHNEKELMLASLRSAPHATAAITLEDGTIQSGNAMITKDGEGRFIVTFSPEKKN